MDRKVTCPPSPPLSQYHSSFPLPPCLDISLFPMGIQPQNAALHSGSSLQGPYLGPGTHGILLEEKSGNITSV